MRIHATVTAPAHLLLREGGLLHLHLVRRHVGGRLGRVRRPPALRLRCQGKHLLLRLHRRVLLLLLLLLQLLLLLWWRRRQLLLLLQLMLRLWLRLRLLLLLLLLQLVLLLLQLLRRLLRLMLLLLLTSKATIHSPARHRIAATGVCTIQHTLRLLDALK
jgi:hypothetical protein